MFHIYLIINETKDKTYIGFTEDINRRMMEHSNGSTKTTANFGNFQYFILEKVVDSENARIREKYWKSCAGRKKIRKIFF